MKFVLASYGSRGDVEPCAAVGRELQRRGHDVRMAVPPDLVDFTESVGLAAVAFGPNTRPWLDLHRDFFAQLFRNFWNIPELINLWREVWGPVAQCREEIRTTLASEAEGADLLVTGLVFEEAVADVAEYCDIPLAAIHYFPARAHGQLFKMLPAPLTRSAMTMYEWLTWRMGKKADDAQRRELGLPRATRPPARRITDRGSLEVQAYDEVCFPGLAAEWAKYDGQRPFVGALMMDLAGDDDDEVASWIAAGKPPIYFGFGSIPVGSPADTVAMISAACAQLGERALVCAGWSDFSDVASSKSVKIVGTVNFTRIFSACRAVVHHGAAGTTAAGFRAGVPQLVLWTWPDQSLWASQVKRLEVGAGRRFSTTTRESLATDLRRILAPDYAARAREVATRTTKPAESVTAAADLVEEFARVRSVR